MIKFLQSNPVQILLCVVVLLDAGIVIAQILLDLHSVRGEHVTPLPVLLATNIIKHITHLPVRKRIIKL